MLQGVFFFSCIWAMGGTLDTAGREKFSIMFRGLLEREFPPALAEKFGLPKKVPPPLKTYIFTLPGQGLVFDYRFIKEVSFINNRIIYSFIIIIRVLCPRAGPSLQMQEPRLQFCQRQGFHRKLRTKAKVLP